MACNDQTTTSRGRRRGGRGLLTVGLQRPWLAAAAARLVDGSHHEHVLGAALQAVHRVVVLLDVGHDHPAVQGGAQAWREEGAEGEGHEGGA